MSGTTTRNMPDATLPVSSTDLTMIVQGVGAGANRKVALRNLNVGNADTTNAPQVIASLATASDVVATFVYDTRLDSDGGAWTEQCSGTSWWQEALGTATRGLKRAFPKVALLVVRSSASGASLTIHDALDLDGSGVPRLWVVFTAGGFAALRIGGALGTTNALTSVTALNGRIYIGQGVTGGSGAGGLSVLDFPSDTASYYITFGRARFPAGLVERNSATLPNWLLYSGAGLVDRNVMGVAARALPGAPLDPASGLPIPTVAVATPSGISVVHPNGLIASITRAGGYGAVALAETGRLHATAAAPSTVYEVGPIPYAATAANIAWRSAIHDALVITTALPRLGGTAALLADGTGGGSAGLTLWAEDAAAPANSMTAHVSAEYITGWMPGDTRLAALGRGRTGSITDTGNLATNGDFATGDLTGWTPVQVGTGAVASVSGGAAQLPRIDPANRVFLDRAFTTTPGEAYLLAFDQVSAAQLAVDISAVTFGGNDLAQTTFTGAATARLMAFVAAGSTTFVRFRPNADGTVAAIDNVSLRLGVMEHSLRRAGFALTGTLSRATVAAGADLAAWSGFSASNYLEQPPNPALDFGEGDFCLAAWARTLGGGSETLIWRQDAAGAGAYLGLDITPTGPRVIAGTASAMGVAGSANDGAWHLVVGVRRSGVLEIWLDGVLVNTAAHAASVTNAAAVTRIGLRADGTNPATSCSTALVRIGATAPTPAQIARMFRDEAPLFRANARAVLGGTSNAVRALSRSRFSRRLAVATGNGVSVFDGLQRVDWLTSSTHPNAMASNDVRAVAMEAGALLIGTASNAGVVRNAITGLDRMLANGSGTTPVRVMRAFGLTTNATPINLSPRVLVGERETLTVLATFVGRSVGASDTQRITYRRRATFFRDAGGNVTLQGVVEALGTDTEATASADATLVVDTTSQTIAAQVTGVAGVNIWWQARFDVERQAAEIAYEEVDA